MVSFSSFLAWLRELFSSEAQVSPRCVVSIFQPYNPRDAQRLAAGGFADLSWGQSATGRAGWLPVEVKRHHYLKLPDFTRWQLLLFRECEEFSGGHEALAVREGCYACSTQFSFRERRGGFVASVLAGVALQSGSSVHTESVRATMC